MNPNPLFYLIFLTTSFTCSEIYANFYTNTNSEFQTAGSQGSLEEAFYREKKTNFFAPNSLFYPPSPIHTGTTLQNDGFLQRTFYENYLRDPEKSRLEP